MADKDYKVQVGVEATADTSGLEQVNKGLDKLRASAAKVNEELDDASPAQAVQEVGTAATDAADKLDQAAGSAETLQQTMVSAGDAGKAAGNDVSQAAARAGRSLDNMGRSAQQTRSKIVKLRGGMMATLNVANEIRSYYNLGQNIGDAIWAGWQKHINNIDVRAVKMADDLKTSLTRLAVDRRQAYESAMVDANIQQIIDKEYNRTKDINELYDKRIVLIEQLAGNRTAELDHVDDLRNKETELQRILVNTRKIRGEISDETANALLADIDAADTRASAKSRVDRQQIMLDAAVQTRDALDARLTLMQDERDKAPTSPGYTTTPEDYLAARSRVDEYNDRLNTRDRQEQLSQLNLDIANNKHLRDLFAAEDDAGTADHYDRLLRQAQDKLDALSALAREISQAEAGVQAVEQDLQDRGLIGSYDPGQAGEQKMVGDTAARLRINREEKSNRDDSIITLKKQLDLADANVLSRQQALKHQREINEAGSRVASAMEDQARATAAEERRQRKLATLADERRKIKDNWDAAHTQLTTSQQYKDRETPRLKTLMTRAGHMAAAGYMSEQDSVALSNLRDGAIKGLPRQLAAQVRRMVDSMIKGYSATALREQQLLTPLERKNLGAARLKTKLDDLGDIAPGLPKDGAAAKIVAMLKDVTRYGVLNDATMHQLKTLTMRINADDAAGRRVVALVRELAADEFGRLLMQMSNPTPGSDRTPRPGKPRNITPDGRDLDAEEAQRQRIRAGLATRQAPRPSSSQSAGPDGNAMVSEFARQMFAQGDNTGNMLSLMQQFLEVARQLSVGSAGQRDQLSRLQQDVAGLLNRERYGRR